MEEKDLLAMTQEELIAKVKEQANTIADYAAAYRKLSAFRNVVSNAKVVASDKFINGGAFYACVTAADDALGFINDPSFKL